MAAACLAAFSNPGSAAAQDLEPRAYAANPVGVVFVTAGLTRSTGAVVTDPTLPISDVNAKINAALVGAGYTFDLFGKVGQLVYAVPYGWGEVSGNVYESAQSVTRSGLTDSRVRLAVNLLGNDAMAARDFMRAPRRTIVGVSLTVSAPTGQYYPDKLINLGTNRWAFKPEVGVSIPRGQWDIDAYAATWVFAGNDSYYPGTLTREQRNMVAIQGHVAYTFKPRLWVAGDATWYEGGESEVAGGAPGSAVNNTRLGLTLSVPAGRWQSVKVSYSAGAAVRSGTDFKTFSVSWVRMWLTRL